MRLHRLKRLAVILFLLTAGSGCAVLTRDQVAGVGRFAAVGKRYGDLPGSVIARHAALRRERQVLQASSLADADSAVTAIENALQGEEALTEQGRQADAALRVLRDYADLLLALTSENYTRDLQASAELLGQNIDAGVNQHPALKASLGGRGSAIAGLVRGAGGIYLRARQGRALQEVVPAADPFIASLTTVVQETMALYLDEDLLRKLPVAGHALQGGGLLAQERRDVTSYYRRVAAGYQGKQPPELSRTVAEVMERSDATAQLAVRAFAAAASYRRAHAELAELVQGKKDLADAMRQVQALAHEIRDAEALVTKRQR